jgi:hypothetical protein
MRAVVVNQTLKPALEPSTTDALAEKVATRSANKG